MTCILFLGIKLKITIDLYFIFGDRANNYNWLSLFLIFMPKTILRTDKGQPRPKYMFNKCGTNIYIFTLQRFSPSSNIKFNCILLLGMKVKITIDQYFLLWNGVNNYNWPSIFFLEMEQIITIHLKFSGAWLFPLGKARFLGHPHSSLVYK